MSNWIHLSVNFKDYQATLLQLHNDAAQAKPAGIYKELIAYLKSIIDLLSPDLVRRYFFLFEPNPHLFLALELKDVKDIDLVKEKINQLTKPAFIGSIQTDMNTGDENNGEEAVDFFCAGARYALHRIGDSYKPGYENNDEVKLVHCLCNQLVATQGNEINFYFKCLQHRGVQIRVEKALDNVEGKEA
jgi:hypothetical protein